jgi:hypothetical protein
MVVPPGRTRALARAIAEVTLTSRLAAFTDHLAPLHEPPAYFILSEVE